MPGVLLYLFGFNFILLWCIVSNVRSSSFKKVCFEVFHILKEHSTIINFRFINKVYIYLAFTPCFNNIHFILNTETISTTQKKFFFWSCLVSYLKNNKDAYLCPCQTDSEPNCHMSIDFFFTNQYVPTHKGSWNALYIWSL